MAAATPLFPAPPAGRVVRVLIDALHARSGGGVTYLRNLLPALAEDPELELHLGLHENQRSLFEPVDGRVRLHVFRFRDGFYRRLWWEQAVLPVVARRLGVAVTFSPANFAPLLAPAPVVVLRNALAVAADEPRRRKRIYWRALALMTAASLLCCRRAIAVSDYARRMLGGWLTRRLGARIEVIPHGVSPLYSPPPPAQRREDFLLAVADLYVQKNLHGLLLALAELTGRYPDIRLKIAGSAVDPDYARRLADIVAGRRLGGHVEMLGHLGAEDLRNFYRRCRLFVFPSLAETFGNPLVEAMACGAPVVCSNATAMPEVAGDAALYFDPRDPADIARAIAAALGDGALRRDLGERALARARRFSWAETGRRTARVIKAAARPS